MDLDTANNWINSQFAPYLGGLDLRVTKMACTGLIVTLPVTEALTQPDGTIAPQALSTLAEVAMTLVCAGYHRGFKPVIPNNLALQVLMPAKGDELTCTATLVRGSKSLIFTRATLTAEPSGKEIATATGTFSHL